MDTHHFATDTAQVSAAAEPEKAPAAPAKPVEEESEEDDDAPPMDMDAFMESGALEEDDPNRYVPPKTKQNASEDSQAQGNADDNILRTRTYDLHITYDKYYQVPRLWLAGYDEKGKPLTVEQMNEDFSQARDRRGVPYANLMSLGSCEQDHHDRVASSLERHPNGFDSSVQARRSDEATHGAIGRQWEGSGSRAILVDILKICPGKLALAFNWNSLLSGCHSNYRIRLHS